MCMQIFFCGTAIFKENIVNPAILRSQGLLYFLWVSLCRRKIPQARAFTLWFWYDLLTFYFCCSYIDIRFYRSIYFSGRQIAPISLYMNVLCKCNVSFNALTDPSWKWSHIYTLHIYIFMFANPHHIKIYIYFIESILNPYTKSTTKMLRHMLLQIEIRRPGVASA